MRGQNEKGVALILTLILLVVLSLMAVSLLFVSQTETWSSMNYRMMTQARYGAESGVNAAANYLMSSNYAAVAPGTTGNPISSYSFSTTSNAVQFAGKDVILSPDSAKMNYPSNTVQSAYLAASQGSLSAGNTTVAFAPSARLIALRQLQTYPSGTLATFETWEITSDGNINSVRNSRVEVSAILEREVSPVFEYAAFASNNGCGSLSFGGGGSTDSYDSSAISYSSGSVVTQTYGGNVGTNGNLSESGSTTVIYGSLSTPRSGVGTCTTSAVTALSVNGNAQVTGGLTELPQPISYPPPPTPSPMPPTSNENIQKKANCGGLPNCVASGSDTTITAGPSTSPTLLGNVTLNSGATLHFAPPAGTSPNSPVYININSLSVSGNANIVIDAIPGTFPPQYAQIVLNIAGVGQSKPLDLTGSSLTNGSLNPAAFQMLYAGTGQIILNGSSGASGLLYAPNASVKFAGQGNWYGAVIAAQITDFGGAAIHYDRQLQKEMWMTGNYMLSSFNWKKF